MNDLDKLFSTFPLETQRILGFPHVHIPKSYDKVKDDDYERFYECIMIYYKSSIIIYMDNIGAFFFDNILYDGIFNNKFKIIDAWNRTRHVVIRVNFATSSEDDFSYSSINMGNDNYRFFDPNCDSIIDPNTIKGIYLSDKTIRYLFKYPIPTELRYSLDMAYKYKKPNYKVVFDALTNTTSNADSGQTLINIDDLYDKSNYKELLNNKKIIHDM